MTDLSPAQDFMLTRRSRPLRMLSGPAPTKDQVATLLKIASRVPDHGKLAPWRFVVLEAPALRRIAEMAPAHIERIDAPSLAHTQYADSPFAIVVLESPVLDSKIPRIEQTYSTGAVCMQLVNAAIAAGFGANWLSGALSHDPDFAEEAFGAAMHERVAGIVHIGTPTDTPPDRPRPDLDEKTTWITE